MNPCVLGSPVFNEWCAFWGHRFNSFVSAPQSLWPCLSQVQTFFLLLYVSRPPHLQGLLITGFALYVSEVHAPKGPVRGGTSSAIRSQTLPFLKFQAPRRAATPMLWWSRTFRFLFTEGSGSCFLWVSCPSLSSFRGTSGGEGEDLEY